MSQTKLNRITVKQRPGTEGVISNGGNTQIFLDGEPLKGVTFLKFEFKVAKPTKIHLEMFANVDEIDGHYELGQYSPVRKSEPEIETEQCAYIDFNDDPAFSIATNLLGQTITSLPPGTELVSVNKIKRHTFNYTRFVFRNEMFKDGAEIVPMYQRDTTMVDGEVRTFDHFTGFSGDYLKR